MYDVFFTIGQFIFSSSHSNNSQASPYANYSNFDTSFPITSKQHQKKIFNFPFELITKDDKKKQLELCDYKTIKFAEAIHITQEMITNPNDWVAWKLKRRKKRWHKLMCQNLTYINVMRFLFTFFCSFEIHSPFGYFFFPHRSIRMRATIVIHSCMVFSTLPL